MLDGPPLKAICADANFIPVSVTMSGTNLYADARNAHYDIFGRSRDC
jgi:hypothetical protein